MRNIDDIALDPMRSMTGAGQSQGEVGLMDSLKQSGEEVLGSRGSGGGNETVVDGEIGSVDLPPQSSLGVPGDTESSRGMCRTSFESLPCL